MSVENHNEVVSFVIAAQDGSITRLRCDKGLCMHFGRIGKSIPFQDRSAACVNDNLLSSNTGKQITGIPGDASIDFMHGRKVPR